MYKTDFTPIDTSLNVPSDEAIEAAKNGGPPVTIELQFVLGMLFPGPNGQPVGAPYGVHCYPFTKEGALNIGKAFIEYAEKLPDTKRSDLSIASNMGDVAKAASALGNFRN